MSFEDAVRDLREQFVRGSDDRLARIEELLLLLEAVPGDARALRDLMIQFHGFSGAGSTYGFPRVSALGAEGQRVCDTLLKEKIQPQARDRERWKSLLESLRRELRGEPVLERPGTATPAAVRESFDILVVDSDPEVRASLERLATRDGLSARGSGSREEALAELSRRMPDGMIVDVRLPDGSGSEFVENVRSLPGGESLAILMVGGPSAFVNRVDAIHCGADGYSLARYIRQQEAHATLPILFLTTKSHIESQIESIRAGGDDYLVKPVVPGLLLSAAAARIERARFLKNLLERDGLTRLLTHTAFLERARAVISEKARNPGTPVAMVVLDLDSFKSLNDRFGHPAGDTVLRSLAGLLRRRLRQSDHLGRLGGDEFAAIIENIEENQAVRLLERIGEEFSALDQVATDGPHFHATFSAGVAVLEPGMDASLWRERADAALYSAKSKGRNRIAGAAGA